MTLWNDVLNQLKIKISNPSYETWFKHTTLQSIDEDNTKLVIGVNNEFTKDWLQGRYTILITEIIEEITGEHYTIDYVVHPKEYTDDPIQHIPLNHAKGFSQSKLDLILDELREMNERISNLEDELQKNNGFK